VSGHPRGERRDLLLAVLVFAIAVFAYAPSLRHDFVDWDDAAFVTRNPMFADGLSTETVRRAFEPYEANWIPLTWLSLAVDHALFGDAPAGYHAENALWHAATAALLLVALARSTGALAPAVFVALCFALHPLRVESVAWVAERKDVLAGFWFVTAIALWLAYGRKPTAGRYVAAVAAGVASLLSKPTAVTLPFVLLLLDFWPLARVGGRSARLRALVEKAPLFALAAVVAVLTYDAQREGGAFASLERVPFDVRAGHAVVSYLWYAEKAFWPTGLAAFYPHPRVMPSADALGFAAFVEVAVTIAVLALARSRPWLCVGWLWFLGMLVPMIGLVQVGLQAHADRYAYLPLVGLEIAVAFEAWAWLGRARVGRVVYAAAAGAMALALGVALRAQLATWRDTETLFTRALAVTTDNFLALERVGHARLAAGDADAALARFTEALRIEPGWVDARAGMAEALWRRGDHDEALWNYREAVRTAPANPRLREQIARALIELGWYDEAILQLRRGIHVADAHQAPLLRAVLAVALARRGDLDAARKQAERALADDPGLADAQRVLGPLRLAAGDAPGAEQALRAALAAGPDDAALRDELGDALLRQGREVEAIAQYRAALALQPDLAGAANDLAWLLATARDRAQRDPVEALRLAEQAVAATGRRDAGLLDTLAVAQAANGRFEDAVATLDAALALLPAGAADAAEMAERRTRFAAREPYEPAP
jgi:tetratricopeptide (TPR) repeat protein